MIIVCFHGFTIQNQNKLPNETVEKPFFVNQTACAAARQAAFFGANPP
jgi:hypothetical protein